MSLKQDNDLLTFKYGVKEDPNFSAAKNQSVIDASIKKYEDARALKQKIWNEEVRDRADAAAMFLKHVDNGKDNNIFRYFGKKELARLRGEDIVSQLKGSVFSKNVQA